MSATVTPAVGGTDNSAAARIGWLAIAAGVLTMLAGVVVLAWPGPTLLVVCLIVGAYLVFWGALWVVRGVRSDEGRSSASRVVAAALGLVTVAAGMLLLVRPGDSVRTIAWILGLWWALAGALHLARGIVMAEGRALNLLVGVVALVAGIVILVDPGLAVATLAVIVGVGLLVQGAVELFAGWSLRRLDEGIAAPRAGRG